MFELTVSLTLLAIDVIKEVDRVFELAITNLAVPTTSLRYMSLHGYQLFLVQIFRKINIVFAAYQKSSFRTRGPLFIEIGT